MTDISQIWKHTHIHRTLKHRAINRYDYHARCLCAGRAWKQMHSYKDRVVNTHRDTLVCTYTQSPPSCSLWLCFGHQQKIRSLTNSHAESSSSSSISICLLNIPEARASERERERDRQKKRENQAYPKASGDFFTPCCFVLYFWLYFPQRSGSGRSE